MADWHAFGKRFAAWLGETEEGIAHDAALSFDYPVTALMQVLPYDYYDDVSMLFINEKSTGFLLELSPFVGCSEESLHVLQGLINDSIPPHTTLQVHCWASPHVGSALDNWAARFTHQSVAAKQLASERTAWLKQHTVGQHQDGILVRDFRVYWSVTVACKPHQVDEKKEALVLLRDVIHTALTTQSIAVRNVDATQFLRLQQDILHPSSSPYSATVEWDELNRLRTQCCHLETHLRPYPNHVQFQNHQETWAAQCLVVSQFPKHPTQWGMSALIGDPFKDAKNIPYPFLMTLTIYVPNTGAAAAKAQANFFDKEGKMKGQAVKLMPSLKREHADWSFVRERLEDGDQLIELCFQVAVFSPLHEKTSALTQLKNVWRGKGWELVQPRLVQWPLLLSMLPLMGSEGHFADLKKLGVTKLATTFNAVNVMPLQGEARGHASGQLLIGQCGQLAFFDPFQNPGDNFNVAVAATSGSGKSTAMQDYIVNLLADNGRCWVVDVGRNYLKTNQWLQGEFIEFTHKNRLVLNPFSLIRSDNGVIDVDQFSLLKPLLGIMARPKTATSEKEDSWIEQSITAVFRDHGPDTTISDIARWLTAQNDGVAKELAHLLFSYTKAGSYGHWFEGKNTLNMESPFIVLELEELSQKKDLREVVLMVLMHHIQTTMYLTDRRHKKSCIIDEAWDLLSSDNPNTAKFIETGYRRARRYHANFVTITQGLDDYYKNRASQAALESSSTVWLFKHKAAAIAQLEREQKLPFNGHQIMHFKSLHRSTCYSKCMIVNDGHFGVYKLPLEPFSRILYSSKGTEFQRVQDLQQQGLTLVAAVQEVAQQVAQQVIKE